MKCTECNEIKPIDNFVPHPCDSNQQVKVCKHCAILIENSYEFSEVMSGRATEREEMMYGI